MPSWLQLGLAVAFVLVMVGTQKLLDAIFDLQDRRRTRAIRTRSPCTWRARLYSVAEATVGRRST